MSGTSSFLVSFAWITFFSYFVTIIASNWVHLLGVPNLLAYFGILLVAVGAEIPDGINSGTVAKRGYGSMRTSSCMGSQITNICLGLGVPWILSSLVAGTDVRVGVGDSLLHTVSLCLLGIVVMFYLLTVGLESPSTAGRYAGDQTVVLGKVHIGILIGVYILAILVFTKIALQALV